MNTKVPLVVMTAFLLSVGCGGGGGTDLAGGEVHRIEFAAVVGESLELGALLFPELAAARDRAIEDKWAEIDAIYEQLALLPLPDGFTPENVCDDLSAVPGAELILGLQAACGQLTAAWSELENLQDAANYAADYLWESNDESVVLTSGAGVGLVTNEGVATISVTDLAGSHTHDIVIDAREVVETVRQLQIQNEGFVSIEAGQIKSYHPDGSERASVPVSVDTYDEGTGEIVLSGAGALLVSPGQLIVFEPSEVMPDGGLRHVDLVEDTGGGTATLTTSEGSLSEVIVDLDLERKQAVDADGAEETPGDDDLEGSSSRSATMKLLPGVRPVSPEEFRAAIAASPRGQRLLQAVRAGQAPSDEDRFVDAALRGSWTPEFRFTFDKTDSQDNESDGFGSMGVSGVIGFSMPIRMYLRYEDYELKRFVTSFKPTQYSQITVFADGDADIERTLVEVRGRSVKFFIGPLPVYVRPIFEVSVGGSAVGNDVRLDVVDYEVWAKYGVSYWRGRSGPDWRPISGYNRKYSDPQVVDGDYSLSAWGQVKPKLRFYGLGGPYARARLGARLTADTSKTGPGEDWAWLTSYVVVSTGVEFDVTLSVGPFDYTLIEYEKSFGRIMNLYRREWDSNGPYEGP